MEIDADGLEIRGLVVLRISEELLDRMLASDIDKQGKVDMCVVGVRATGPSHTVGVADVEPKPDRDDAAFRITVEGESHARTSGRSGPAIVNSRSVTTWKVDKVVRFDKGRFLTEPGTIESHTRLGSAGIGSTLPGLRGEVVRRLGTRRELKLRPAATRSVNRQTSENILAEVDESIDKKVENLNANIESRAVLERLLPLLDTAAVQLSTNSKCIHLAFQGMDDTTGIICPLDRLDPAETELWINTSLLPTPIATVPDLPNGAAKWIGGQLQELGLPEIAVSPIGALGGETPLTLHLVDDWIVLRTELPESNEPVGTTE